MRVTQDKIDNLIEENWRNSMLNADERQELVVRLQTIRSLQGRLWEQAVAVADDVLHCELEPVMDSIPELALAFAEGEDLTDEYLNRFVDHCRTFSPRL